MARILVIDDNRDNLDLISYLLKAYGHVVLEAIDGESGIETARRERPDLILCDIHLPRMDGYEVAKRLRQDPLLGRTPLIAVTALAMMGDRGKGLAAGFDDYIDKPLDPGQFVPLLEKFLRADQRGTVPDPQFKQAQWRANNRPSKGATILVVDDSAVNRELIRDTLAPLGYEVWLAASVEQALARAKKSAPDLILSDLHMPGADGFNLIRAVKADARLANVPFLFISSSVWGESDRALALELGVTRFLLRPIEPQALIDEVVGCLLGPQR